jgi:hypothetical protein
MAVYTANKIIKKCATCGDNSPKELVQGPRKFRKIGLINPVNYFLIWRLWSATTEMYCSKCGNTTNKF